MSIHAPATRVTVRAGGKVDVRFVTLVRGFGRQAGPDNEIRVAMGTIALIRVGGYFTGSGYVSGGDSAWVGREGAWRSLAC